MSQAREALEKNGNDVAAAIAFLKSASGGAAEKKAGKVAGRSTEEGTIAVSLLGGRRVSLVHLACETDFVARNDVFLNAARGIAGTAAFLDVPTADPSLPQSTSIQTFPVEQLLSAPLISIPADGEPTPGDGQTIKQLLLASLAQTSENLKLQRAVSFAAPFPAEANRRLVPGAYTHGGDSTTGKVGGIVVLAVEGQAEKPVSVILAGPEGDKLESELNALARNIARQVVGFPTKALRAMEGVAEEEALLSQPGMMLGTDKTVSEFLREWSAERGVDVSVVDMRRWSTSDVVEEKEN